MNKGLFAVFGVIFGLIMMNHAGLSTMSHAQAGVVSNVISPNRISANRISANRLGLNKLASNGLDGAVDVRALAAQPLVKADQ